MIFCNVEKCKYIRNGRCTIVVHIENGECADMDANSEKIYDVDE